LDNIFCVNDIIKWKIW